MKSLRRRRAGTQVYMLEAIVRRAAAAGQERDHAAGHVPRRGMIDQVGDERDRSAGVVISWSRDAGLTTKIDQF